MGIAKAQIMPNPTQTIRLLILLDFSKVSRSPKVAPLPHRTARDETCGSILSACRTLALAGAALLPGLVQAGPTAGEQIERAVARYLDAALAAEAAHQGWHGMRFNHDSTPLNSSAQLSACRQPLSVGASGDSPSVLARQRLEVSCADQPGWTVVVSSQADVFLPAVVASRVIERGQSIRAEQVRLQELNIGKAPRGFFTDLDAVIGQGAKRRIRANQLLNPSLLTRPTLVRRGQRVKIVASHDGIQASTLGEALENGQLDAVIRIRNLSSEKTIEAKVLEAGVVSSTFR